MRRAESEREKWRRKHVEKRERVRGCACDNSLTYVEHNTLDEVFVVNVSDEVFVTPRSV